MGVHDCTAFFFFFFFFRTLRIKSLEREEKWKKYSFGIKLEFFEDSFFLEKIAINEYLLSVLSIIAPVVSLT